VEPGYKAQPMKKQKFVFEMCYLLNCYSTISSKQQKEIKQLNSELQRLKVSGEQDQVKNVLQSLKPNDTIIWSNINGNEYQIGAGPNQQAPNDGLEHLTQNTKFENEISHFGFTHEPS
jgi:hypothetical protein